MADIMLRAGFRGVRVSGNGRLLLRLRRAMLTATVALLGTSFLLWQGVQGTAETIRDRTAPAIITVSGAKTALVRADQAAVRSFNSPQAALTGPGEDYRNQIALASQNLARAAELNEAGGPASRQLQIVEALLAEYTGAIEQADAHYRQPGGTVLGIADLWNASRLLRSTDEGVLVRLDSLAADETAVLDRQVSQSWSHPLAAALWVVPAAVLLALLIRTQWTLRKRFHRRYNPSLIAATLLLVTLCAGMSWTFVVEHDLQTARQTLQQIVADRNSQAIASDVVQRQEFQSMLDSVCGHQGDCGPTAPIPRAIQVPETVPSQEKIIGEITEVNRLTSAATGVGWLGFALALLAVAIGALVPAGLQARIDEYRYRS